MDKCYLSKAGIKSVPDNSAVVLTIRIALCREAENTGILIQSKAFFKVLKPGIAEDFRNKAERRGSALAGDDFRVSRKGISKDPHTFRSDIIRHRDEMVCVVPQNIPADRAGLAAAQSCHDRIHIAGNIVQPAVICLRRPEDAVCLVRFHDRDDRSFLIAIKAGKVTA